MTFILANLKSILIALGASVVSSLIAGVISYHAGLIDGSAIAVGQIQEQNASQIRVERIENEKKRVEITKLNDSGLDERLSRWMRND